MLAPFDILKDYDLRGNGRELLRLDRVEEVKGWRGIGYRIGKRFLVSPYKEVVEITRLPAITPVLGAKPWMAGLCNLNGELYPVISLGSFLDERNPPLHEGQRVLVMDRGMGQGDVILAVDEILGHRSFEEDKGSTPGPLFQSAYTDFVSETFQREGVEWGLFSLTRLSEHPSFQSASAL